MSSETLSSTGDFGRVDLYRPQSAIDETAKKIAQALG
jgi:hypothetical protein